MLDLSLKFDEMAQSRKEFHMGAKAIHVQYIGGKGPWDALVLVFLRSSSAKFGTALELYMQTIRYNP